MKIPLLPLAAALLSLSAPAQTTAPDVGSGAPNEGIHQSFLQAYFRNGFNNLVVSPPLGNVKTLGSQALVQEFTDIKSSTNKYALCKPNVNAPALAGGADMVQIYPALYSYYTSVGPNTAGYPTTDTLNCPSQACQYQLFDKPYALFVYKTPILGTGNFPLANPFFTKWQAIGGVGTAGGATAASLSITSASGIAATAQTFEQAAIFNITSGVLSGRLVAVGPGVYPTYTASGSYTGPLGLPVNDEQVLPSGLKQQAFQGGTIQYDPLGATPAAVLYPIYNVQVAPSGQIKLNLGDSVTLTATEFDPNGNALTGRAITWSTSNSNVVSVQAMGLTATIKAVGGGSASVTASGEGKASLPVSVLVSAPCCAIGEGAPTPAIQQAFQDAVARTHVNVVFPGSGPVSRLGAGYVQNLQDAVTGSPVLLALSDKSSAAYLVSGPLLAGYLQLGGPAGPLGYPSSDATPAGRQLFENKAALAGNPVQLVSGGFLLKWAALQYEAGPAGLPTAAATPVLTFNATPGLVQNFANGLMVSSQTAQTAFFTGGPIAMAWTQAGGASGSLGLPLSDEYASAGRNRQDFEGGSIDYAPGDTTAQVHLSARKPLVTATPSTVLAGTRLRLAVGGFDPASTLKISITGQPDFTVTTAAGAYAWQTIIPSNATAGTISIHAADTATSASADGSYTIRTAAGTVLRLAKTAGDSQTGLPGATLPQPLDVLVTDSAGIPVSGLAVQFSASPGARVIALSAFTDASGHARATAGLPPADGIALFTAAAGKQLTTFSAQAVHGVLPNFPKPTQADPDGGLATSTAAILRYYQASAADPQGQLANLWRLGNIAVSIVKPDLASIRNLLGQGAPVLLVFTGAASPQYAVAVGVNADGSLAILDPNPTALNATPSGALRFVPQASPPTGFLVSGDSDFQLHSPAGDCGNTLTVSGLKYAFCDGSQPLYQLDTNTTAPFHLTVAGSSLTGTGLASFSVLPNGTASPQILSFTAAGVVNAASYAPSLSPGALFTIFGSGLTGSTVQINGFPAALVPQSGFQISGVVPSDLAPGGYPITVSSPYGSVTQNITLLSVSPGIFVVVNQNGSVNSPDNPAQRGQVIVVYCTGLGTVAPKGALSVSTVPVTALLSGTVLTPSFAGLAPGFIGLYQVNINIPSATPPGLGQIFQLQQAGVTSNPLEMAIQ